MRILLIASLFLAAASSVFAQQEQPQNSGTLYGPLITKSTRLLHLIPPVTSTQSPSAPVLKTRAPAKCAVPLLEMKGVETGDAISATLQPAPDKMEIKPPVPACTTDAYLNPSGR